jgi:hypothetical protein
VLYPCSAPKVSSLPSRGGIVKAMAICTHHPFIHVFKVLFSSKYLTTQYIIFCPSLFC